MKHVLIVFCLVLLVPVVSPAKGTNAAVDIMAKSSASWDGSPLHVYAAGVPEISILRIKIPPNFKLPLHKHPVISAGVLLTGQLTVVTDRDEVLELKAGDPIIEVVNKWHYGVNKGTETAEIIVFYAGVKGVPISTKGE